jgi:3-deoxy-7-phosphoheptulonate synthase
LRFTGLEHYGIRDSWRELFAESPDVLKSARRQQTVVSVLHLEIGGGEFVTMAGPCSVETEFQLMATANHLRCAGARILRGGAFKPRSSPYAFQGHGLIGLKMLARARQESGLAIVTEVISEEDVPTVAEYADILQIGTRNMENYPLLEATARSGRPVLLKRGMVTVRDSEGKVTPVAVTTAPAHNYILGIDFRVMTSGSQPPKV